MYPLRPYNQSGPGQTEAFVIPAFAMQIAKIEAGLAPPRIQVGNLDAERDFLDVRDVTDAYARASQQSGTLEPGGIFNIASGIPTRIGDVLQTLLALSCVKIEIVADPARMRSSDLPRIIGNADRAKEIFGWAPLRSVDTMLSDVLEDCRERIAAHQA